MARKENQGKITGGLSFDVNVDNVDAVEKKQQPTTEKKETPRKKKTDKSLSVSEQLQEEYESQFNMMAEAKTARIQVVTTPTVKKMLKELEKEHKIKSMNHLINTLLEAYLGLNEE